MTGATFLALVLLALVAAVVLVTVDQLATIDHVPASPRPAIAASVVAVGHGPAVTTLAPDPVWLAAWMAERDDTVTWSARQAEPVCRVYRVGSLPLTERCRWPSPLPPYPVTEDMEAIPG